MPRLNAAIKLTSRIVDIVVYPVYLLYASVLFRAFGLEDDVPEDRPGRVADGHPAELVEVVSADGSVP